MNMQVLKRDGSVSSFTTDKIRSALVAAFLKNEHGKLWTPNITSLAQAEVEQGLKLTDDVVHALSCNPNTAIPIAAIHDQVELALMRSGQ